MKKIAILVSLALILALAVVLWAQRDPEVPSPYSKFYGHIYYSGGGCACRLDDYVFIQRVSDQARWEILVTSCGANGAVWSTEAIFPTGQYYIWGMFSWQSGCDSTNTVFVNHNGNYNQEVDLYAQ